MDDKFTRQYDYKANSNLVLQTDTRLIDKRSNDETTGEVQSLVGRISGKMGDKVSLQKSSKDRDEEEKRKMKKRLKQSKNEPTKLKQELSDPRAFSVAELDTKEFLYQPKSDFTKAVYDLIIKFVRKQLGFQHSSIITGAADEIISTMKDQNLNEEMRRLEVDKLLSSEENLSDDSYNELCNLCKKINDWQSGQAKVMEDIEEEQKGEFGIIVSDEDENESSDDYLSEIGGSDAEFDLDEIFEKEAAEEKKGGNKQINDLDELAKRQVNIIPKIDIPEPIRKEGYQEYHIAAKKRQSHRQDNLIKLDELPEIERKAFGDIKSLNVVQSKIYKKAMTSDKSLLICAPTGAGKTNIAIMTMLRVILKYQYRDGSGFDTDKFKIIYVAPIKALVQEIVENFSRRLGGKPYNLKVEEFTGDHQLDQVAISRSQIIVCTPEKWDIVTRKSVDRLYTKIVKLVIFDEIHLLHNERGATLEALVARIKRHKQLEGEPIRIIGLSATLPNYKDVSRFIAPDESEEDSTFYFDSTYRPIPLKQQYVALTNTKKSLRMINDIVYDKVIERLAENAQILIFVHSRPDTVKTAEYMKCKALEEHKLGLFMSSESAAEQIREAGNDLNPKLRELLQFGFGIHHAGLSKAERSTVEELFRGKFIKVLVSTATLAWGVNLPARTVIIKGTQVYKDGRWTDLDSLDVTQMLGRAGRPGYDKEGEGIVITQQSQVNFYMSLMTEQLPVESKLISRLAEFINAECVIGNIESIDDASGWISETYLSSRMATVLHNSDNKQYLTMYGIDQEAKKNDSRLIFHKRNLAYIAACALDERGLIVFDRSSGLIRSTELGRIASHYNCSSRTIKLFFDSIHEFTSDIELFRTFSLADEFSEIYVRKGEELDLQTLLNQVPFPIDDKRATPGANKVNALLQVYIFRMNIESSDLTSDMHFIKENAARLARAIHEIVLIKGYAHVAELSFDLCRKIDKRMTICHSPLRQFSNHLDADIINKLEKKNYHIDELRLLKSDKLTELLRCERKYGEKVYKLLKYLPKLKIEASVKPVSKTSLKIDLIIEPDFSWSEDHHNSTELFWLFVEDVNQEILLHYETVHVRRYNASDKIHTTFYVPYLSPVHPFYYIRLLPDRWFGCDHHLPLYIEKLTLPDESIVATQPLDLEPQTARSLGNPLFERVYEEKFRGANFNQIQTQAFKHLYTTDDDIILLAAAGSGKTTCAEFAIIRCINTRGGDSKCGYIAANLQAAQLIYESWVKLFGRHYGVILLSGNHRLDASRVDSDSTNIVIGYPETWHVLSLTRSKKYRKLLNKFHLFIIDDIHLLNCDRNSTLEWVCSKIRIITKLIPDKQARIVALGSPMACAESLRSWLAFERGSKEPLLLNYLPSIRPVKLELIIQKFHHYDYKMRLLTMRRPVYRHVIHGAQDKPVMIFVADFAQALEVCEMLINYSKSDGIRFTHPILREDQTRDSKLREYVNQGVGYLYSGMDYKDRILVEKLYDSGQILILVAAKSICWSLSSRSYMTIVMDTQQHNGQESTDYELTDIMQMVGLTGRTLNDHECKCIIMCQTSKADFYGRFLREPLTAESELPSNLISHVNYEIATGALTEFNNIYKPYLAHTFFYKRITINPNYYGIIVPEDTDQKSKVFGSFFNNLVYKIALELKDTEFITMDGSHENPNFNSGLLSKISLEYYINFETLANYVKWLTENTKMYELRTVELIELISTYTHEFKSIPIRHGELPTLKSLQRRHRPRERDQLCHTNFKIKLLIFSFYQKTDNKEDYLGGELYDDRNYVISLSHRLLMAVVDIAWLKDSFSLAKTSIQLAKKLVPFCRQDAPNLDLETKITRTGDQVKAEIIVTRENDPFSLEEFNRHFKLPITMYRDEGWCFLVHGQPPSSRDDNDKFLLFKRVKTPSRGSNEYKLEFMITDISEGYTYELFFMSDFYSTREDRKVEISL